MYLPEINQNERNRDNITALKGYNHNLRIDDAEFYDMKNMTGDNYPVISSRDKRKCVLNIASNEYEEVESVLTKDFIEESLSLQYAWYTLDFPVVGENEYVLEYVPDNNYVGSTDIIVTFFDGEGEQIGEGTHTAFKAPAESEHALVVIRAYKQDGIEGWAKENLDLFVTGFRVQRHNETIRGMLLKNGKLAYLIGGTLYWNGETFDFSAYTSGDTEQQLISYGAYILIFPAGVYLNTQDIENYGYLGASYVCGEQKETVTYSMCDLSGADYEYTLSETAPEDPEDGQYWMKQSEEGDSLYQWADTMAMWVSVPTTYVKIKVNCTGATAFPEMFKLYDSVHITGTNNVGLDGVNVIRGIGKEENGTGYILVTGVIRKTVTQETEENPVIFERRIPKLDYVCVSNNRVWGCFCGVTEEGESLNEIYASKLGDATNWYNYMGTAQDSYALSLGDDGEFTGAYTYQGYPLFFKENNIYKIYGTYPAAYQLVTYDCRGLQKGSSRSLAVVDEYLVYKSISDICVFDGNYPMSLSEKLGRQIYTEAAGGAYMGRYYISMKDESGKAAIFVYDFTTNMWMKDEEILIEEFVSTKSGELYGRTKVQIVGFGNSNNNLGLIETDEEQWVEWFLESGDYGHNMPNKKRISRIAVRAAIDFGAELRLSVNYDDEDRWHEDDENVGIETGDGRITTYVFPVIPKNCDTMKIRLSGIGKVHIYSISRLVEEGGDL